VTGKTAVRLAGAMRKMGHGAGPTPHPGVFSLVDGLIRYKSHIWLGHTKLVQQHVLQALHSSGIGSHFGIQGTYQRVNSSAKVEHVKLLGML
jgi:hypothetical protein